MSFPLKLVVTLALHWIEVTEMNKLMNKFKLRVQRSPDIETISFTTFSFLIIHFPIRKFDVGVPS